MRRTNSERGLTPASPVTGTVRMVTGASQAVSELSPCLLPCRGEEQASGLACLWPDPGKLANELLLNGWLWDAEQPWPEVPFCGPWLSRMGKSGVSQEE